ncbi:MAG: aminodeoxychorismate/anthranilate synthase component II [Deltaproteobacteria bacterium]|jgi:anthranilate synthase component 2|nr:aminodeoxychorismate/anthranilate synthase component II [Deltaproteobacteria bacterium]
MRVLLLDCKDSFTYNLAQLTKQLLAPSDSLKVVRNDHLRLECVLDYDRILLSPGPGVPEESENLMELIELAHNERPILGVCLGHQALAQALGAKLTNLERVYHGVQSEISILSEDKLFRGLPPRIKGGRYHSWVVDESGLPQDIFITAKDDEGLIMAFSHKTFEVYGVQFHPESILTPTGARIVANFLGVNAP